MPLQHGASFNFMKKLTHDQDRRHGRVASHTGNARHGCYAGQTGT